MSKPKLQIIVLFQNLGERQPYFANSPAPPLPGLLLAGLTPDLVEVEVLPEMVRPIDYETDADFIALSFMDYCFPHARRVAERFRRRGKKVIAGFAGDMGYAKELLREIAKLHYWAVGFQFTFNCLKDDEFVDLLQQAHGAMAFIGLESLNQPSLYAVQKRQNKVHEYQEMFRKLRERGVVTFTGMMLALEEDTSEYYRTLPERIEDVDPSTVLLSIAIPIPGTPFAREVEAEGRIFDQDLSHYEGDHLVFLPHSVSPDDVFDAYDQINRVFYSWPKILQRGWRLVWSYVRCGRGAARFIRWALIALIFLKVSLFERDHAQQKVYAVSRKNRAEVKARLAGWVPKVPARQLAVTG